MRPGAALLLALLCAACSAGPPGAADPYARGVAALEAGDPRTARVEFLNAIKANPRNSAARVMQARAYLALGDGVAAEAEIRRARELGVPPDHSRPLMAHALLLQGRGKDALAELDGAAGPYADRIRGRTLALLGDRASATAAFDSALAGAPKDAAIWTDVARFRREGGDIAGALAAIGQSVAIDPRNVEALSLHGELTRSQYGLRAAVPWFDRAIEVDPDNVEARLERAATLGDLGEMRAMLAETRKVLSLSRGNAMAYYLQAMLAARARKFPLARSLYQRTGGKLDGQPAVMLLAGAIDFQTGNIPQAVTRLSRLVEIQPDNRKARKLLAAAHWRGGDARAVVATLAPIADRPDADSYALTLMGKALAKLGDGQAASVYLTRAARPAEQAATALFDGPVDAATLAQLRDAAAASPDEAPAQIQLIRALFSVGQGEEALQRARRLQSRNPGAPDAHILVGDALGIQGDFRAAAEAYRKAGNITFSEPVAMRLIEALDRSGQRAAAGDVLALFLQQNPRNTSAQLLAAGRYLQARQWRQAIVLYEDVRRRLGDSDAAMLNNLAWAYSELGNYDRALPLARKAWSLDRDNPATTDTLGWLLFKSGEDRAQGLALLERAARGAPADTQIRGHVAAAGGR